MSENEVLEDLIEEAEEAEYEEAEAEEAEAEEPKEKKEAAPEKLARGRMPAPLVWFIRFKEEGTDSEVAHKYFTTPGKISDIRKNRGFKYITEETKFSKADIDAAIEKVKSNFTEGKSRGGKTSDTTEADAKYALESLGKVPVSDESTLEADRAKDRKPRGKSEAKAEEPKAEAVEEVAEEAPEGVEVTDDDLEAMLDD